MRYLFRLVLITLVPATVCAQNINPLYEMRAVWVTTLGSLDWPGAEAQTPVEQEKELRGIIRHARSKGLNTILFQAVSRGDALYESRRLPWAPGPTGISGRFPGFDPLAVAIEEAHKNGMELHVWFNVYRVSKQQSNYEGPQHITEVSPQWTEKESEWLNPGYPGVNEWILQNVIEVVENYDIDAIHFDFIRYDRDGYDRDEYLFSINNPKKIKTLDEWRRDNVNSFVRNAFTAITERKPWVKVGSTILGNYDGACLETAFLGSKEAYQDGRIWLAEGVNDYIIPQIYWPIDSRPGFGCLVQDWVGKNTGVGDVYTGIGAYKPEVQTEIDRQITVARDHGARGFALFRDAFIRSATLDEKLDTKALTPPVHWRQEAHKPSPPGALKIDWDPTNRTARLEWDHASAYEKDPLRGYAVYRRIGEAPNISEAVDLYDVIPQNASIYVDTVETELPVYYSIVALSRLGIVSEPTPVVSTEDLLAATDELAHQLLPYTSVYPNPFSNEVTVTYALRDPENISIRLLDVMGRPVRVYQSSWQPSGAHQIKLDGTGLADGVYYCEIRAGKTRKIQPVVLAR